MRIASYNVENLFDRARALNQRSWAVGRPILADHAKLSALLQQDTYTDATKTRIVDLLRRLGLAESDEGPFVRLRQNRGRLVRRPKTGGVEIVASGRSDWIGWAELTTEPVDEIAMANTARVISDVGADVLGVVEAESRVALKRFTDGALREPLADGVPGARRDPAYPHVMLVDGNDERGIDVGVLTKPAYPLRGLRSHVDDVDDRGRVFSRDCPEYEVLTPTGDPVLVLLNHLKSKGYGGQAASSATRRRQAQRIAEIYRERVTQGVKYVAVLGDLNDTPASEPLAPLLDGTDLRDISDHPDFDDGGRPGTYGNGTAANKIDYVLLSPSLYERATGGGIWRKGVWGGRNGTLWPVYDTMTAAVHAASDHAAVYADLAV
jgi:endonuclease/exonuclease/phosphatase family metal-dependent hydrolase